MKKFILLTIAVIFSFTAFSQEISCENAVALTLGVQVADSTSGECPVELQTIGDNTYRSGWSLFKFVPASNLNGKITISNIARIYDPEVSLALTPSAVGMYLYTDCPTNEEVTAENSFVASTLTQTSGSINAEFVAEQTYYIAVYVDSLTTAGLGGFLGGDSCYTTASFRLLIEQVYNNDISVTAVTAESAGCAETTTVNYTLRNAGQVATISGDVVVKLFVNGATDANDTFTLTDTAINPGANYTGTFTNVELQNGENTIQVVAEQVGDEVLTNNTNQTVVTRSTIISTFPMIDDFSSEMNNWTPNIEDAWVIEAEYEYAKTDTAVSMTSNISSPCLDFSAMEIPTMRFDFKADFSQIVSDLGFIGGILPIDLSQYTASMTVQASIDGGTTWTTLATYTENIEEFETMNIDLAQYAGQSSVIIRFNYADRVPGISGIAGGFFPINFTKGTGVCLDNIVIKDAPQKDLQLLAITEPLSGCGLEAAAVKVQIKNLGRSAQNNYSVAYSTNGGTSWSEAETITAEIAAGATYDYTFTNNVNLSEAGQYTITAKVILEDDEDATNNQAEAVVVSQGFYNEVAVSFDDIYAGEFVNDWYAEGTNSSWEFGETVINEVSSGTWATNLNASANPGEVSYLYSPCYDLSGLTNPIIKISLKFDLSAMNLGDVEGGLPIDFGGMFGMFGGKLALEYTTNGGTAWVTVPAGDLNEGWYTQSVMQDEVVSGMGWSNTTDDFVTVKTSLDFISANPQAFTNVKFRFAFRTSTMSEMGGEDMPFDFSQIINNFMGQGGLGGVAINQFHIYSCTAPAPEASFTYEVEPCTGNVVFTNTSQNANAYNWNFGDNGALDLGSIIGDSGFDLGDLGLGNSSSTSNEENPQFYYQTEGDYTVVLIATNACGSSTAQEIVSINFCTLIDGIESAISVYPNPASSIITIENAENSDVQIINALGQVVVSLENISNNEVVDLSNLTNGTYFVKVANNTYKLNIVR